jgi:2-polyprenyl-3-methyl-5-hydroxy-6-metoxy-1,4-benzoquinol methylase
LAPAETSLRHLRWSKNYYEPARDDIVKLLPKGPAAVLSFGCGWGAIEGELVSRGLNVSAVPMDSVIASCVKARGVTRIIYGDIDAVLDQLTASSFDCVVLNNLLHLVQEPRSLLESLVARLRDGGTVIMSIPNLARLPLLWRTRHDRLWSANDFRNAGLQPVSLGTAKRWCARAQLAIDRIQPVYTGRATTMPAVARTIASNVLATEWLIRLRKA